MSKLGMLILLCLSLSILVGNPALGQLNPPQIDADTDQILKQVANFYSAANAIRYVSTGTVSIQSTAMSKDMSTKTHVTTQRPNLVQVKVQQGSRQVETYGNGTKVFSFVPSLNAYITKDSPPILEEVVLRHVSSQGSVVDDGRFGFFYLMADPYQALVGGATSVKMINKEPVNGIECTHLRVDRRPYPIDLWFRTGDQPVLIQVIPDTTLLQERLAKRMGEVKITMAVTYSHWEINPTVPVEAFTFVPPEGAEEKTSFMDMMKPKDPKELIGKPTPLFTADLLEGGNFNLAEHKGKNIVVLDFWATWCGPCVYALPILLEVTTQYKDKGVVFMAVNEGDEAETIRAFQTKKDLKFPVAMDLKGEHGSKFYVGGIPQTVIINKEGVVSNVHVGMGLDLKTTISQELDMLLGITSPVPAGGAVQGATQTLPVEPSR
jgi:peroxiredoxin